MKATNELEYILPKVNLNSQIYQQSMNKNELEKIDFYFCDW